jgi:hypothetical protein
MKFYADATHKPKSAFADLGKVADAQKRPNGGLT